jgi:hypothetical protein
MRALSFGVLCAALAASPAFAQGNSQSARANQGNNGNGHGAPSAAAPSRNQLAAVAVAPVPSPSGATPLAWVDDASLLPSGMVSLSMSAMRWAGGGTSEIDAPIVDVAFGLAPRLQLSASVPRVVGSADPSGAVGGVGTSFFTAKVAVYEQSQRAFKVAASPTLQLLGEGVVASLGPGEGRVRWGLPVSAEISRGVLRLYGGGGYFSPGLWFSGAAVGAQAASKVFVSGGFSRAWRNTELPDVPLSERDRKEISGGAAYVLNPTITVFGSVGRTIKTLEENGAGTSLVGGVSFSFATAAAVKP